MHEPVVILGQVTAVVAKANVFLCLQSPDEVKEVAIVLIVISRCRFAGVVYQHQDKGIIERIEPEVKSSPHFISPSGIPGIKGGHIPLATPITFDDDSHEALFPIGQPVAPSAVIH